MEERVTEEEVLASINFREQLIERCKRVVQVTHGQNASHKGVTAREFVNLAKELRESGIRCVQKIVAWTMFNTESDSLHPKVFLWNEIEYLCKMLNDLDFIAESLPVTMKQHGGFRFK
jgi:putative cell wall-binding protein